MYRELIPQAIIDSLTGYNRIHRFLKESEKWDVCKIYEWQLKRLQFMVSVAYNETKGYRQLYDEKGVKPSDLQTLSDIERFPLVTKDLIRNNLSDFSTKPSLLNGNGLVTTGGSTGLPFEFYQSRKNTAAETAFINYTWESVGWKRNQIGIKIRGTHIGSPNDLLKKIARNRYAISSSYITPENYNDYIKVIQSVNPSFIHAYPSSLTDLSQLIIENDDCGILPIKHIFLGSENFYPWQQSIISKAFPKSIILPFYGLSEHTVLASWCENNPKYHINPFYGYTEVVNSEGKAVTSGELGEIIGTSFWNTGTLFIRYRSGDNGVLGNSSCGYCGRHFQLLENIDGRLAEFVVSSTGRRISLTVFAGSIMHGKNFEHIKQFRFIQYEKGSLTMAIIPTRGFSESDFNHLTESVKSFLGDDFDCKLSIVEELPLTKRGKFSYLEQHLNIERADINV